MNATATVLIVDDIPANIGLVAAPLEARGLRVLVAQSGEEALRRIERTRPDLILLDVMMPGMDGFAVCRSLKADADSRDIPVIFMTALADGTNKLAGFEAGGVDYITKPVDPDEVAARVDTHLALRRLRTHLDERNRQLERMCQDLRDTNRSLSQARAQLVQSEKMASIGLLAAGVAHEINNPLGYVSSNLATLAEYTTRLLAVAAAYEAADPPSGTSADAIRGALDKADLAYLREDLPALFAETMEGVGRVKRIVQDLMEFSHAGTAAWRPADLNRALDGTLNLVAHALKHTTVRKDYGALPPIECLPAELNQVFMNLLVNAAQAIPERGEIALRTWCDGNEAWVEIADTGGGIAPEHLGRIFDPFFTTRTVGQGTGLGLSLSYATVKKHGGQIEVDSHLGQGTRVRIGLPVRQPAPGDGDPAPASPMP